MEPLDPTAALRPIERRRLRDVRAGIDIPKGRTLEEKHEERNALHDAIAAGQSLDDIGPELNKEVMLLLDVLLERHAAVSRAIQRSRT